MPKDSKIIKNQIYKDYMEDDLFNENEGLRAQGEIAVTYTKGLNFINKDIRHLDFMKEPEAEKEIPTIEQYYIDQEKKKELARLEQEKAKEEEKKIEEPVDLSEADAEFIFTVPERRVSYRRTFGITKSRKRDINKYTTIALLTLTGILALISFLINKGIIG